MPFALLARDAKDRDAAYDGAMDLGVEADTNRHGAARSRGPSWETALRPRGILQPLGAFSVSASVSDFFAVWAPSPFERLGPVPHFVCGSA